MTAPARTKPANWSPTGSVTVDRDQMLAALRQVMAAVPARTALPIVANITLETKGPAVLRIRGTDLDLDIETSVLARFAKPLSVLVNGRQWYALIRNMPASSELTLTATAIDTDSKIERPGVVVTCGDTSFQVKAYDPADAPRTASMGDHPSSATFSGAAWRKFVPRIVGARATDDSRPVLTSVYYDAATTRWCTADGFRLTTVDLEPDEGDLPAACFPAAALIHSAKFTREDDQVTVLVNEKRTQCEVAIGATTWRQSLIQGTFPNYSQLFPGEWTTRVTLPRPAMVQALKLLGVVSNDGSGIIRISLNEGMVTVAARADELGSASVRLLCPVEGEQTNKIAFNWRYLSDAMRLFDGDVVLEWTTPSNQGLMHSTNPRETTRHLLMPMFVQW